MTLNELKSKIRTFIASAQTKEALDAIARWAHGNGMEQTKGDIALLQGDLKLLDRERNLGLLSHSDATLRQNQLNNKVLGLLASLETTSGSNSSDHITINKTITVPKDFKGGVISNIISPLPTDVVSSEPVETGIYFSYAWGDEHETGESREQIVHDLYQSLKTDGYRVLRDKEDVDYKGLISDFMKQIGKGDCIVVAISDKYLKSENCMFEMYEIYRNSKLEKGTFLDKIFPIRVESIALSQPKVLASYFQYWLEKEKEWEELIKMFGTRISSEQQNQYRRVKEIAHELGDFLSFLNDMNAKSKAMLSKDNFAEIKKAIQAKSGRA